MSKMPPTGPRYGWLRFLRPYQMRLALVLGVLIVTTGLGLLQPFFIQQLIDQVLLQGREDLIWIFPVAILTIATIRFGLGVFHAMMYASITTRVLLDMRVDFVEHLQKMSPRFFSGTRFGDVIIRLNRDLTQLQELSTGALLGFASHSLTLVGVTTAALLYQPKLFLICAIPFPVALAIGFSYRGPIRRLTQTLRQLAADLASQVMETLSGMRTVKTHGRERGELARFLNIGHQMLRKVLQFQRTRAMASGLPRLCLVISSAILYSYGGLMVVSGEMPLGVLVALGLYLGMAFAPLHALVELYLQLVQGKVALERVREIREQLPEVIEVDGATHCDSIGATIELDAVQFRYHPDQPLLEKLSLRLDPSETVALVGASGAGKSTIVDLMLRFLDPQQGQIRIDGTDLKTLQSASYRRHLALVSTETFLFHGSIRDNILFGKPSATDEEMRQAAIKVGLPAALGADSAGLETIVGERGEQLSAGQKQRVGIARALLREPSFLILDEATAHLDLASDRQIRDAIAELMEDATTLVITHRVSTIADVDRILVLDQGRIVEQGTPKELMRAGTAFQEL
ncbi:MAG: ABC transporter ATP-binding protein, partial [Planctomycetes bacterium]|nr:ABC transporter ATP-binding protein [Planctomycetota bacterium]MBT6968079.1 ABC transporter ATP-binding protein [Planctomycetota bacterium]